MDHVYLLFGLLASLGAVAPETPIEERNRLVIQCAKSHATGYNPAVADLEQAKCRRNAHLSADRYEVDYRAWQQRRERAARQLMSQK